MQADQYTSVIHFRTVGDVSQSMAVTYIQENFLLLDHESIPCTDLRTCFKALVATFDILKRKVRGHIVDLLCTVHIVGNRWPRIEMKLAHVKTR